MRKLAPAILAALVLGVFAEAQTRCRNNTAWCIGTKDTDVIVGGNLYSNSADGGLSLGTGTFSGTVSTLKADVIDGGAVLGQTGKFNTIDAGNGNVIGVWKAQTLKGDIVDAGSILVSGITQLGGPVVLNSTTASGSCTLNNASPSVCTATVTAGTKCICAPVGTSAVIAGGGCAVSLSSTTLTITAQNTVTHDVNYHCF